MFLKRLFSTVVLLALFAVSIFAPNPYNCITFLLLSTFLTFGLVREIRAIAKNIAMETCKSTLWYCTVCVFVLNLFLINLCGICGENLHVSLILFILTLITCFAFILFSPLSILFSKNEPEKIRTIFNTVAISAFILIPVILISIIYFTGLNSNGLNECEYNFYNWNFLIFILMTKIGDIGAYVVGTVSNKLLKGGNHKMIPSISPGKSWEGAAGGLIISILLALAFYYWIPEEKLILPSLVWTVVSAIFLFFGSMAGDLMESAFKRAAKVKDSGNTIPGIGGVFDLVDSLFVTAPVYFLILAAIKIIN